MVHNKDVPQGVRYEYALDAHATLHLAHGVWGGVNPQGEIELNFYTESDKIPPYSECIEHPQHGLEEVVSSDENMRTIIRHIHSRVVLNYYTAHAIIEWLEAQLTQLEQLDKLEQLEQVKKQEDTSLAKNTK